MNTALETVNLTKSFGSIKAADDINVKITEGEFVGIVGANGSGKTTFLNLITGYLKAERGRVHYWGQDISGLSPRAITTLGLARSFQIPQLYLNLTVQENILLALAIKARKEMNFLSALSNQRFIAPANEMLGQFGLEIFSDQRVSELPEGERKLLDIALSLASQPKMLLMDEPTSGVSAKEKIPIMDKLVNILRGSVTTIFIEHDMEIVQRYADRIMVFFEGKVLADGLPSTILQDRAVRRIVFGKE